MNKNLVARWRALSFINMSISMLYASFLFSTVTYTWINGKACPVPSALLSQEQITSHMMPNCTEFWFNRYQSFFGSILSVIAALIAAGLVFRQLGRTDTQIIQVQSQIPLLRAQSSAVRAEALRDMITSCDDIMRLNQSLIDLQNDHISICSQNIISIRQIIGETNAMTPLDENENRLLAFAVLMDREISILNNISDKCSRVSHPLMYILDGNDFKSLNYGEFARKIQDQINECRIARDFNRIVYRMNSDMRNTSLFCIKYLSILLNMQEINYIGKITMLLSSYRQQQQILRANLVEALSDMVVDKSPPNI